MRGTLIYDQAREDFFLFWIVRPICRKVSRIKFFNDFGSINKYNIQYPVHAFFKISGSHHIQNFNWMCLYKKSRIAQGMMTKPFGFSTVLVCSNIFPSSRLSQKFILNHHIIYFYSKHKEIIDTSVRQIYLCVSGGRFHLEPKQRNECNCHTAQESVNGRWKVDRFNKISEHETSFTLGHWWYSLLSVL